MFGGGRATQKQVLRLPDRQVGWLIALQNMSSIDSHQMPAIRKARAEADETTVFRGLPDAMYGGNLTTRS